MTLWQYRSGKLVQIEVVAVRLGGERAEHGADARPALRDRIARLLRHRRRTQPGPTAGHHRTQVSQKVRLFQLRISICNHSRGSKEFLNNFFSNHVKFRFLLRQPSPNWKTFNVDDISVMFSLKCAENPKCEETIVLKRCSETPSMRRRRWIRSNRAHRRWNTTVTWMGPIHKMSWTF